MGDYIDRDAVFHAMKMDIRPPFAVVRDFPAADVAPVVHGRWVRGNNEEICLNVKCSVCGMSQPLWAKRDYKFCPDCGAKMDKEDSNQ